mmetsp:Transcript_53472/g.61742  ORF Transcript_53472/g.61742 Transcript_53472/m.61742 type:complete len:247 (-) Transcript_53472:208-948(-)|eukprot:CAMPEP_0170788962 /NCGR_PEP_ID=MMETSP0733-20121128/19348_1 /TAXON_ID=186038 /ORGANISM="Fragilariopsis kerguelensis, Strain L26-C5" /LENGTH=246 /DNA_ID=CAMNT_0011135775 /DNA_START=277 /DNA_END=1017 /DNA_ORIENTATION=+
MMDRSDTNRTDAAQVSTQTTTAVEANANSNTDITKALHDAMSIPKLTVVRQQALLNELVEHSCTKATTTTNYDYAATFYNQLLLQTQTMAHHTENCLDDQRDDDSAVLDGAVVSSPLPLPLPSTVPSTLLLPSPSSVELSSSSFSISYLEDHNEEEQGITCVYHESGHNENELSSSLGESDNNKNNNGEEEEGEVEEEGEGDNSVDKEIHWKDPDLDPYAYKDDEEEDDTDEECDNVAVESIICQE